MSEFTKGDWYVYGLGIDSGVGVGFSGISICELKLLSDDVITKEENTSNANLIAAAPDMYELLVEFKSFAERQGWDHVLINDAEKLLTKARGEIT